MKRIALVALAVAAALPLVASARHADVIDANDTNGLFDVRRVEMGRGTPNKWRITTWPEWSSEEVWDRGFVLVYIDTFGTRRADYYALIRSNGSKMVGTLFRDRSRKKDFRVRRLDIGRGDRDVVTVEIPFGGLRRRGSGVYRWYAQTLWSGGQCRRICFDRAPDQGKVTDPVQPPTPTIPPPTATPPTPSPTTTP